MMARFATPQALGMVVGGGMFLDAAVQSQAATGEGLCEQAMIGLVVMLVGYVVKLKLPTTPTRNPRKRKGE